MVSFTLDTALVTKPQTNGKAMTNKTHKPVCHRKRIDLGQCWVQCEEQVIKSIALCRYIIFLYIRIYILKLLSVPRSLLLEMNGRLEAEALSGSSNTTRVASAKASCGRYPGRARGRVQDQKNKCHSSYSSSASLWGYFKSEIRVHSLNILPKKECCPATTTTTFWKEVAAGQVNPVSTPVPCISQVLAEPLDAWQGAASRRKSCAACPRRAVRQPVPV